MNKPINVLCNTTSYNHGEYPSSILLIKNPYHRKLTGEEFKNLIEEYDPWGIIAGLASNKLGGAALDVFEEEPYEGPLIKFRDNTILTPHVGSHAGTCRYDIEKEAMDNLLEGLRKKGVDI